MDKTSEAFGGLKDELWGEFHRQSNRREGGPPAFEGLIWSSVQGTPVKGSS